MPSKYPYKVPSQSHLRMISITVWKLYNKSQNKWNPKIGSKWGNITNLVLGLSWLWCLVVIPDSPYFTTKIFYQKIRQLIW